MYELVYYGVESFGSVHEQSKEVFHTRGLYRRVKVVVEFLYVAVVVATVDKALLCCVEAGVNKLRDGEYNSCCNDTVISVSDRNGPSVSRSVNTFLRKKIEVPVVKARWW